MGGSGSPVGGSGSPARGSGAQTFAEIAEGVYVLRYPVLDVNVSLLVGDGAALLVDTLASPAQAAELRAAVRAVTSAPVTVVNTHHHFDHCFGNAAWAPPADVWAHEEAAALLRDQPDRLRRDAYDGYRDQVPDVAEAAVVAPTRTVHRSAALDIGGRTVELRHLGRGHTGGDLVVVVPDAGVVIAGDLVEEGADPAFDDAYPLDWPGTVAALLGLVTGPVVPGHGGVVDRTFVAAQHADLATLEWLIRDGHADGAPPAAVAARAPFGPVAAATAVRRGYAELAGRV